jgi:hypothetical protein
MSGKRQHFIPRFLQEGFAVRSSGGAALTWVYKKGNSPFRTNIINVGVEGQFFTLDGDAATDARITDEEQILAPLVHALRQHSGHVDATLAANLIAHLEARTRHFRQSFVATAEYLVSRLADFMEDGDAFEKYFARRIAMDPTFIRDAFVEEMHKKGLPPAQIEAMLPIAMTIVPHALPKLLPGLKIFATATARQLRTEMPKVLAAAAKSGHIRALRDTATPTVKASRYALMTFELMEYGPLVLGDSPVLFAATNRPSLRTVADKDDNLTAIYLPLTPRLLLLGSLVPTTLPDDLGARMARCSLEHFISPEDTPENITIAQSIGADAALMTNAEIEAIISEILSEPFRK